MNDSIFTATMADMTRPELIRFIKKNPDAAVLLPLGVIEAHGSHLCLGTDIYSAHEYCRLVSEKLAGRPGYSGYSNPQNSCLQASG